MSGQALQPIMVLGAAGVFGSRLCRLLLEGGAHVVGVGRRTAPLDALVHDLSDLGSLEVASGAVPDDLDALLRRHRPEIVIDTTGPFQGRVLDVPTRCIAHSVHYVDLSDDRAGVAAITALDTSHDRRSLSPFPGTARSPSCRRPWFNIWLGTSRPSTPSRSPSHRATTSRAALR